MAKFARSVIACDKATYGFNRWYAPERKISGWRAKKTGKTKEYKGEIFYEVDDSRRRSGNLYCKCGHVAKGKLKKESLYYNRKKMEIQDDRIIFIETDDQKEKKKEEPKDLFGDWGVFDENENQITTVTVPNSIHYDITREIEVKPVYECENCGLEPDIAIPFHERVPYSVLEYVRIWDNREKETPKNTLTFGWGTTYYIHTQQTEKLGIQTSRMRITVNLDTGMSYLIKVGKRTIPYNITFGRIPKQWMKNEFSTLSQSKEAIEMLFQFLEMCLKERGVHYTTLEDIVFSDQANFHEQYYSKKNEKGQFESKRTAVQSYGVLKAMAFIRYPQLECSEWKDWRFPPDHIKKRLKNIGFKQTDIIEAITGHKGKSIRKLIQIRSNLDKAMVLGPFIRDINNLRKFMTQENLHDNRIDDNLFGIFGHLHFPTLKKAMIFLRKMHDCETHFVTALLKLKNRRSINGVKTDVFELSDAGHYIRDLYIQYVAIKEQKPDYQIKYDNDIRELHDNIARDYNRLQQENRDIPYRENEFTRYQKEIDGYQFTLAKDTYQLVDVGNQMNICVGGYRDQVLSRTSTIVLVQNKEKKLQLCIEIQPINKSTKQMKLIQAKLHRNNLPLKEEAILVKNWCEMCGVESKETYDLRFLIEEPSEQELKRHHQQVVNQNDVYEEDELPF